jgi:hypothetical protein
MKRIIVIAIFIAAQLAGHACPVCERNKPEILKGVTHSQGPDSIWDYVIVSVVAIIALLTLFYSVKWLLKPDEKNAEHIKCSILNQQ